MITTTNTNEKLYFKYLLNNKYFEHSPYIFSNTDIKCVYDYIKSYYSEFNSIPMKSIVYEKTSVKREIIDILFNLEELDNIDNKWLSTSIKDYLLKRNSDLVISQLVDDSRNGNYEALVSKLNISAQLTDDIEYKEEEIFVRFTDENYNNLPNILKDLTNKFEGKQKDVLLTSILSCISIFFSNVKGEYFNSETYNNIYTYIVGESGIGKSIMKNAKILTDTLNKKSVQKYNEEKMNFDSLDPETKKNTKSPIEHLLVAGADATQQAIMKYLNNNDGKFLIFATEAEALTAKIKDVNGDYTIIIRESIQNDSFVKILKSEDSVIVDKPKLNLCISGTYDQIGKLIGKDGAENGTLNRFLYYYWHENNQVAENPFKNKNENFDFIKYGDMLYEFYDLYFNTQDYKFILSSKQEELLFNKLNKTFDFVKTYYDTGALAIVKRHYLFAYKLMITFACLRIFDDFTTNILFDINKNAFNKEIRITDEDCLNVLSLIDVYIQHSLKIFCKFESKKEIDMSTKPWKMIIWEEIGDTFNRNSLINLCLKHKKSEKTADRLIKEWKELNKIKKEGYNLIKIL